LFINGEVFNSVDECRTSNLNKWNRSKGKPLQLLPGRLDPNDETIAQSEFSAAGLKPTGSEESLQVTDAVTRTVEPKFPPVHARLRRVTFGCPEVFEDSAADARNVRDKSPVLRIPRFRVFLVIKVILEELQKLLSIGVGHPYGRPLRLVSVSVSDGKQKPFRLTDTLSLACIRAKRVNFERKGGSFTLEDNDRACCPQFFGNCHSTVAFLFETPEGILSGALETLPVRLAVLYLTYLCTAPAFALEVRRQRKSFDVEMIKIP
jgi:hypothetical protein